MPKEVMGKKLILKMTQGMCDELDAIAVRGGTDRSSIIRLAIREYLFNDNLKLAARAALIKQIESGERRLETKPIEESIIGVVAHAEPQQV